MAKHPFTGKRMGEMESRAYQACKEIKERLADGGSFNFTMVWKKSRTWGHCPSIILFGGKVAHASGCGYCKESACLADALRFMADTPEQYNDIDKTRGRGESAVIKAMKGAGYILEKTYYGDNEDGYTISKA